jgi:FtsP/CotA-like multicopper oxidase with cupredoxin domain
MTMNHIIRRYLTLVLILFFMMGITAATSLAATYNLRTGTVLKTMPDGTAVSMWGFGLVSYDPDDAGPLPPVLGDGIAKVPGPEIVLSATDTSLTINLENTLPVPVSIIIPGLPNGTVTPPGGVATPAVPTWTDGLTGSRTSLTQRVKSLTLETPTAQTWSYSWTIPAPGGIVASGTYLYKSGTHMQVQVPMGLYGAMKKNAIDAVAPALAEAYPGKTYAVEQVLLFSEVDLDLNDSVVTGNYAGIPPTPGAPVPPRVPKALTSTNDYKGEYFLINGEPFSYSRSAIPIAGLDPTTLLPQTTLLRFLNAGNEEYIPALQGIYMDVIAEDGKPYPFPKNQYSLLLAGGKTIDALVTPTAPGYIPLYDGRGHLTNAASSPGGMRVYLNVPDTPPATSQLLTVATAGTGAGKVQATSLPGGIDCGAGAIDCTETYNHNTVVALTATPDANSAFMGWSGGLTGNPTTVTMSAAQNVTATFNTALPTLTVTLPNAAGTVWTRGSLQFITWSYTGNPGPNVRVELWNTTAAGVLTTRRTTIKASTPIGASGTGSFRWKVPSGVPVSSNYKIKVISATNVTIWDASDNRLRIQ